MPVDPGLNHELLGRWGIIWVEDEAGIPSRANVWVEVRRLKGGGGVEGAKVELVSASGGSARRFTNNLPCIDRSIHQTSFRT